MKCSKCNTEIGPIDGPVTTGGPYSTTGGGICEVYWGSVGGVRIPLVFGGSERCGACEIAARGDGLRRYEAARAAVENAMRE